MLGTRFLKKDPSIMALNFERHSIEKILRGPLKVSLENALFEHPAAAEWQQTLPNVPQIALT